MAYQVLARKYRPQRFADVVGQDHVTVTLMNALAQNRIAHGYIFSGHRGIGKTTIARILAMALNCRNAIGSPLRPTPEPCEVCESCTEIRAGNAVDVIEIDAATNRGIDEIRELRDAARYRPARDRYKIYILDEAHQITDPAFNALLKTLEEPPDHIVFMMATTQPEDIPQTVRSRCQHFSFHAVKLADILSQLRSIATAEGVLADDGALSLLAEAGDGSMRDALSIMDQAIASAPVEPSADGTAGHPRLDAGQIRELMGSVPNAVFERILEAIDGNRSAEVMTIANQLLDAGNSPAQLARQCVRYLRNALVAKIAGLTPENAVEGIGNELLQISPDEQRRTARTAALFSEEELTRFLQVMLRTFDELGYRQEQRFHFELGLLKLVHLRRLLPLEEALSGIKTAEPAGGSRATTSSPAPRTAPPSRPTASAQSAASSASPARPAFSPPAFSPFEQDSSRKDFARRPPEASSITNTPMHVAGVAAPPVTEIRGATVVSVASVARPALESMPIAVPAAVRLPGEIPFAMPSHLEQRIEQQPDVALPSPVFETAAAAVPPAQIPTTNPAASGDPDALQAAVVSALAAAKQSSAADAMADAAWTVTGAEATIQTGLSKTLLPHVINAEAEKIVRNTLRAAGISRFTLLPGAATPAAAKKPKPTRAGSVHAKALEHPMVQQAQKLFDAEIQTVIDLREDE
jgi:DNA polymerase-3 subunit gamma/tau